MIGGLYKTTTRQATEEYALPVLDRTVTLPPILEIYEDRELYHSVYQRNGKWKAKTVQDGWDRCQERLIHEGSKKYQPSRSRLRCASF